MSLSNPNLICSRGPSGEAVVRLGMPSVDEYPEYLECVRSGVDPEQ